MKRGGLVGIGLLIVIVIVLFMAFGSYVSAKNGMVAKQEAARAAHSEIDVDLQRRANLIPNLVETVKGYAKHEETVFGDIANARAGLLNAQGTQGKLQADTRMEGALGRLLAISENYPDLKSNQNFLALQDQLEGTENRIAVATRRYNLSLQDYNTYIRQFPNSIWAGVAGFQPNNEYFEASEASRATPTVKF